VIERPDLDEKAAQHTWAAFSYQRSYIAIRVRAVNVG